MENSPMTLEQIKAHFDRLCSSPIYHSLFRFSDGGQARLSKINGLLSLKSDDDDDDDPRPDLCDVCPAFGKLKSYCDLLVLEGLDRGGFIRPGLSVDTIEALSLQLHRAFEDGSAACAQRSFTVESLKNHIVKPEVKCRFPHTPALDIAPSAELAKYLGLHEE